MAVTVSAVFSFLVGLFLLLEPELVFQLLRTPEDAFDGACLYTRIVGGTVLLQGLYIQLCAVLRSYTLLKEVVVLSVSMNLLNVAGNAILINGFFEENTIDQVLLIDEAGEVKRYEINTVPQHFQAMCVGTFQKADSREVDTFINKTGLSGKYQVKVLAQVGEDEYAIYETGVVVTC